VNEIELATLAGFFAGEGNITISGGKWPTLYAALGNTERFWVEKLHNLFGGAFYIEQPKYTGAKFMFRWRVTGKGAEKFLRTIAPYLLGEKAEQLKVALEFQAVKGLNTDCGTRYTDFQLSEMNRLYQEIQSLRRTAAETNRRDAQPVRSDSPILGETREPIAVRR